MPLARQRLESSHKSAIWHAFCLDSLASTVASESTHPVRGGVPD